MPNDEYGLPKCGNPLAKKIRAKAMQRLEKSIRDDNRIINKENDMFMKNKALADELRFYKKGNTISKPQQKKLDYLESLGFIQ